jgi:hypothetical protein
MRRCTTPPIALALAAAVVTLLAGCSSSDGDGGSSSSGTVDTIRVTVKDGKVTPAAHRERVASGDKVKLVVTTDAADEVHVHGVNIEKETEPGKPTTITFVAEDPGLYEVETHETDLQLLQIEVR